MMLDRAAAKCPDQCCPMEMWNCPTLKMTLSTQDSEKKKMSEGAHMLNNCYDNVGQLLTGGNG